MSVVMMTEASTPGAVKSEYWSGVAKMEIWTVETHKGLVVNLREMNGYDDSDFYAVIWNEEKGAPEEVMYATTRGWTYPNGAAIDASPEVMAKYDAYYKARMAAASAAAAARAAKMPAVGKKAVTVRNVKGKSAVAKGVEGVIVWVGKCSYSGKARIGLKVAEGMVHWIVAEAVEVVA